MPVLEPSLSLGRHVFGVAALVFGAVTLAWHDYPDWDQLRYMLNATSGPVFVFAAATAQIFGGAAIQFARTAKTGAVVLGAMYAAFALLCVPQIIAAPLTYNSWGNFFEQFSLVTGAAIVYARSSPALPPKAVARIGRILLGICTASFALEQALYLNATARLVPKWLPPSPMFWAVATTILFALAAVALMMNRMGLIAARLLTMMIAIFGILVWVPLLLSSPHDHATWSETVETFAIAAAAWILADFLGEYRLNDDHSNTMSIPADVR